MVKSNKEKLKEHLEGINELLIEDEELNNLVAKKNIFSESIEDKIAKLKFVSKKEVEEKAEKFIENEIENYKVMEGLATNNKVVLNLTANDYYDKYKTSSKQLFVISINEKLAKNNLNIHCEKNEETSELQFVVYQNDLSPQNNNFSKKQIIIIEDMLGNISPPGIKKCLSFAKKYNCILEKAYKNDGGIFTETVIDLADEIKNN